MQHSAHRSASSFVTSLALVASGITGGQPAVASSLIYEQVAIYETTIPATDDPASIYYPIPAENVTTQSFPLVLMLQGAFVDKADYSEFSERLASYGFVVVVPNHERSVLNPQTGEQVVGFAAEQRQVYDVLDFIEMQEADSTSPIAGIVDRDRFALVGHSLGGYVGISTIQGSCLPLICSGDSFQTPPELDAGVFYGTTFEAAPQSGVFPPIENAVPLALIAGSEDGVASYDRVITTYEQIQNPPAALILVPGANHYGITNENSDRDPNPPLLEQSEAIATIAHWAGQFLRAHLWDDAAAFEAIYGANGEVNSPVQIRAQPPLSE